MMHLDTLTQIVEIAAGMIPVGGFLWWLISPRLAALSKQVEPDHDPNAPTMRQLQEEQTATLVRIESKFDERLTKVEGKVDGLVSRVDAIDDRLDRAGIAK